MKLSSGPKIHFVVMGNVFPPNKDIHETFDLKGSTVGRYIDAKEREKKAGKVTVAGHESDEVPPKTLKSILKQAGLE